MEAEVTGFMSAPEATEDGYTPHDRHVAERLFTDCYRELLAMARLRRRRANFSDTMQSVDVLHEVYLKLCGVPVWQSRAHFMSTAALAIRQVVVTHARERLTAKRGGGATIVEFREQEALFPEYQETPEQIAIVGDLLTRLESENPRWARIVDCRYFAGLTEDETAFALGISSRTVRRAWTDARAWLAQHV